MRSGSSALMLLASAALALGCAGAVLAPQPRFDYFARPDADDAWSAKIAGWQRRERLDGGVPFRRDTDRSRPVAADGPDEPMPPAAEPVAPEARAEQPEKADDAEASAAPRLRDEYFAFRNDRKRELARAFAEWIQNQAREHYVPDGPIDHWATLEETLRADGDDCDGLELLTFHGLRDLGFDDHEVYRSIVFRPSDGQHHMVTLWFEDPDDPWVIDPTGAMTRGMPRMSELPEWVPLKLFGEREEYTVRPGSDGATLAASGLPGQP